MTHNAQSPAGGHRGQLSEPTGPAQAKADRLYGEVSESELADAYAALSSMLDIYKRAGLDY